MVLDLHREALFVGIQAWAAGYRPALHDAVELEPKVVMQPRRVVLLDDVTVTAAGRLAAARLGRDVEFPFLAVLFERHSAPSSRNRLTKIGPKS